MKRSEAKRLGQIIDEAINMTGQADDFNAYRLSSLWPDVVGQAINRMTTRRYVDSNHIFHVYLTSAVVKNELSFNRTALVEALNRAVGSTVITDIKFH